MIVRQFDLMPVLDVELQHCFVLCGKTHQPRKHIECVKYYIDNQLSFFQKSNSKLNNTRNSSDVDKPRNCTFFKTSLYSTSSLYERCNLSPLAFISISSDSSSPSLT